MRLELGRLVLMSGGKGKVLTRDITKGSVGRGGSGHMLKAVRKNVDHSRYDTWRAVRGDSVT